MKRVILITILLALYAGAVFSADYEEIMKTNIDKIYELKDIDKLSALANQFERISNSEKDKWLPVYYAAYCYVRSTVIAEIDEDEKSMQLDKAQEQIDKIIKTYAKESEIYTLQALLYQLRITGASTGYKYSKLSNEALAKAEEFDAANPRIYYLRGSNTFHTPKIFGGGKKKAKPFLEKAAKMFTNNKPLDKLAPTWGAVHNKELLKQCGAK